MKTLSYPKSTIIEYLRYSFVILFLISVMELNAQSYSIINATSTPGVNGIYTEDGTYNSVAKYTNGAYTLFKADQNMKWAIVSNGTSLGVSDIADSPYNYSDMLDQSTPPVRAWHNGGNTTGLPGEFIIVAPLNSIGYNKHWFIESPDDDGSIRDTMLIYLYADGITFTGNDGDDYVIDGKVTISNLPSGLTAKIEKLSDTTLIASLAGNADNHTMNDNIDSLSFAFLNTAVSNGDTSAIGYTSGYFKILFQNPYTITGAISNRNANGKYVLEGMFNENPYYRNNDYYLMTKGCYPKWIIRINSSVHPLYSTQLESSWPLNRQWHLGGFFYSIKDTLEIAMENSIVYESYSFIESEEDNGAFNDSIKIRYHMPLSGSSFSGTPGEDFVSENKMNVYNVPAGLSAVITKYNDTVLYARLAGQETVHDVSQNISDLIFEFKPEAFSGDGIFGTNNMATDSFHVIHMQKYVIVDTTLYSRTSNGVYYPFDIIFGRTAYYNDNDYYLVYRSISSCVWSIIKEGQQNAVFSTEVDEFNPPDSGWAIGDYNASAVAHLEIFPIQPWLGYYELSFQESEEDPGTIENTISVILNNGEGVVFSGDADEDFVQNGKAEVLNVPEGLTPAIIKVNDTLVDMQLSGEALHHQSEDNIDNVTVKFSDEAFSTSADQIKFTNEYDIRIVYKGVTAIKENDDINIDFIIYPNPAKNYIAINSVSDISRRDIDYKLFDITGNIVKQGILFDHKIDISPFPSGVYFLRLTYDDTSVTKKVIFD